MGRGKKPIRKSAGGAPKTRGEGPQSRHQSFLPNHEEARNYYRALYDKHFSDQAVGSRFTENITLEKLVGRLPEIDESAPLSEQDDREYFRSKGITDLKEDVGYFRVPAKGVSRLVPDTDLGPEDTVEVREVKPGFLSFITDKELEVSEEEATILVGKNPEGSTPFQVITTFPGLPHDPSRSGISSEKAAEIGLREGKITLSKLQSVVGKDLLLQSS